MSAVAFYISGHGLGHASRQIAVINALGRLRPDTRIEIRTSAPAWLFHRTLAVPAHLTSLECDTGAIQRGSLAQDGLATLRAAAAFHQSLPALAEVEARKLTASQVRLVAGDVPPLAFAAAARAGVPSVAIANFTWDWIYEDYAADFPEHAAVPALLRETYSLASAAWRLPMAGGFESFSVVVDLPWIAQRSRHDRMTVRTRLGLPLERAVVLVYLGHYGVTGLQLAQHRDAPYTLVAAENSGVRQDENSTHVHFVREARLQVCGLGYEDLVRAVDVVVTKPGYGIIASAIANNTALLYTDRGRFREYGVLVHPMPRVLRCAHIENDVVTSQRWDAAVAHVLGLEQPPERPPVNGAEVAAGMIATFLR